MPDTFSRGPTGLDPVTKKLQEAMLAPKLRGVFAIMATPFDDQGTLDEASLKSLIEFELRAGVAGLTILGIMGEAHKQADEERRRVRWRGVIRIAAIRTPGMRLDPQTRAELDELLGLLGLAPDFKG